MNSFLSLLKTLSITTLAGALGAGFIYLAIEGGEIDGAASGKKLGKKKNQAPVWEEIGRELMPTPAPSLPPAAAPNGGVEGPAAVPTVGLPADPLLDPRDPEQCARETRRVNRQLADLVMLRGEVRGYYQDPTNQDIACEVDMYPKGCGETQRFVIAGDPDGTNSPASQSRARLCTVLSEAYMHGKSVYVQGKAFRIGGIEIGQIIERIAFTPRTMDEFAASIQAAEQRQADSNAQANEAARRDAEGVSQMVNRMFHR